MDKDALYSITMGPMQFPVGRMMGKKLKRRRDILCDRQKNKCHWCGVTMTPAWSKGCGHPRKTSITVDHVIPLSEGGRNFIQNMVAACSHCNNERNRLAMVALKQQIVEPPVFGNVPVGRDEIKRQRLLRMERELNGG